MNPPILDERTSVVLIERIASIWSAIRSHHHDVPGVVLLAAPAHRDQMNVLGHFAPLRWKAKRQQGHDLHEVVVIAEHLDRPVEEIVGTLLHEAAHAMNFELGISDCSRSQYHNKKFRDAAEVIGLEVQQVPHYGYAFTRLTKTTLNTYKEEIAKLNEVLVHRRRPPAEKPGSKSEDDSDEDDNRPTSRSRKAVCACPFIIRVSAKTLQDTTIRCESCGQPFQLA